ncbi:9264_t:CDS:2, partial [Racocetra persica]
MPLFNCSSPEIKEYIQQNELLTVPQIYHNIKVSGLNEYIHATQQQIYYWCKRLGVDEYKMAEDQVESTIKYLSQQSNFNIIIQQPTIIAFTTPLIDIFPKDRINTIRQEYYPFLRFTEKYNNQFEDLPENLFLLVLNKPAINYISNQHNTVNERIPNASLIQENTLSQDDTQFQDDDTLPDDDILPNDDMLFQDDELPPMNMLPQDN